MVEKISEEGVEEVKENLKEIHKKIQRKLDFIKVDFRQGETTSGTNQVVEAIRLWKKGIKELDKLEYDY